MESNNFETMVQQLVKNQVAAEVNRIVAAHQTEEKEILTMEEAAEFLGLSRSYLYKVTKAELIPYYKPLGKIIYFEKSVLKDWIRSHKGKSKADVTAAAASYVAANPL